MKNDKLQRQCMFLSRNPRKAINKCIDFYLDFEIIDKIIQNCNYSEGMRKKVDNEKFLTINTNIYLGI